MTDNDKTELSHLNPTNANSDCTGKSKKIRSSNPVESLNSTSELLTLAKDVVNNYEQYPIDFESRESQRRNGYTCSCTIFHE
jgi:hypothetical protein